MEYTSFLKCIDKTEKLDQYDESGATEGLYMVFSKWKDNERWSFVQSFVTLSGLYFGMSRIDPSVYEKQYIRILFINGNDDHVIEIVNTLSGDSYVDRNESDV